jgi:hypothetical protein
MCSNAMHFVDMVDYSTYVYRITAYIVSKYDETEGDDTFDNANSCADNYVATCSYNKDTCTLFQSIHTDPSQHLRALQFK